jgi:hypothetical protein
LITPFFFANKVTKKLKTNGDLGKLYRANEWSLDTTDIAMQILGT